MEDSLNEFEEQKGITGYAASIFFIAGMLGGFGFHDIIIEIIDYIVKGFKNL